ncbi:MAG: GTPase Era [Halieaceae bacterium]|nr:GTPase Era [Halieaceae bacterium]
MKKAEQQRSGYVAIVGRPNVGKSTLLNHFLGQKLSITSRKPQTTRHQILGIKTRAETQIIYVDTPGLHIREPRAINRYMNQAAGQAIRDVDVVVMVVDRTRWTEEDELVLGELKKVRSSSFLAINKVDLLADKEQLLPHIQVLAARHSFRDIVPVSALRQHNMEQLEAVISAELPRGGHFFPATQLTDRSRRFLAAELVREKITRQLGDELPYAATVEIEQFKQQGKVLHIDALILVEREGQKHILIGNKGGRLRSIGTEARGDMESLFESQVMLRLWAKVKSGWSDDQRALHSLGYRE